jgi:hypothetical protein
MTVNPFEQRKRIKLALEDPPEHVGGLRKLSNEIARAVRKMGGQDEFVELPFRFSDGRTLQSNRRTEPEHCGMSLLRDPPRSRWRTQRRETASASDRPCRVHHPGGQLGFEQHMSWGNRTGQTDVISYSGTFFAEEGIIAFFDALATR